MQFTYLPKGVCSSKYVIEVEDNKVKDITITGGCQGNLRGIRKLIMGMDIDEVINRLQGIECGPKSTSCPDQIAKALQEYKDNN